MAKLSDLFSNFQVPWKGNYIVLFSFSWPACVMIETIQILFWNLPTAETSNTKQSVEIFVVQLSRKPSFFCHLEVIWYKIASIKGNFSTFISFIGQLKIDRIWPPPLLPIPKDKITELYLTLERIYLKIP